MGLSPGDYVVHKSTKKPDGDDVCIVGSVFKGIFFVDQHGVRSFGLEKDYKRVTLIVKDDKIYKIIDLGEDTACL